MIMVIRKLIALLLCIITMLSISSPVVYGWTSQAGVKATSIEGENYVGLDGKEYFYSKQLTHIIYDENGDIDHKYIFFRTRALDKYYLERNETKIDAFCIEAGAAFENAQDGYTSKSYKNSNYFNNLPTVARLGIMTTLVYGWTDKLPTELNGKCNKDDFLLATQLIIWEYQQQIRTSPTNIQSKNGVDADTFSHAIEGRPAKYAYDYLLNRMEEHTIIPSFCSEELSEASTYTLKYDSNLKKYTLTLTDTNNTLKDLKLENSNGISVSRNGNQYTFTSLDKISGTVTITAKKDINDSEDTMLIWGRGGKQTMATGFSDPVSFYLKFNTESDGKLKIVKTSEDKNVSGIKFNISGNNLSSQFLTTKNDGTAEIDLLPGTYTITEETENKYETQETKTFTIKSGETTTVTFNNILKKGSLKVIKTSEDNLVEGRKFHLFGNSFSGKSVDEYAITDSNRNSFI